MALFKKCLSAMTVTPAQRNQKMRLDFRDDPPWPKIRRLSCLLFMVFFSCAVLTMNPRAFPDEAVNGSLSLLFGGLALLAGSPLLLAVKGRTQDIWIASFTVGLLLVVTAVMAALDFHRQYHTEFVCVSVGLLVCAVCAALWINRKYNLHSVGSKESPQ
jgi:hypothetical protein